MAEKGASFQAKDPTVNYIFKRRQTCERVKRVLNIDRPRDKELAAR